MKTLKHGDSVTVDLGTVRSIRRAEDIRRGVNYKWHQRDHKEADINKDRQGL